MNGSIIEPGRMSEPQNSGLRPWVCIRCGYLVHSVGRPEDRTWSDGTVCTFARYQPGEQKAGDFAGRNNGRGTQAPLPFS